MTLEQLFAYPQKQEQHPNLAEIVKACGVQDEQGRFSMRTRKDRPSSLGWRANPLQLSRQRRPRHRAGRGTGDEGRGDEGSGDGQNAANGADRRTVGRDLL
jgi:hypothetical protein